MLMDKVTESITHFIGLFHISLEQARARSDYTEFDAAARQAAEAQEIAHAPVTFRPGYSFNDPDPGLRHVPGAPEIVKVQPNSNVAFEPIVVTVPRGEPVQSLDGLMRHASPHAVGSNSATKAVEIDAPGQVGISIVQHNVLYDDDYVSIGGHGLSMAQIGAPGIVLDALVASAQQADPLDLLDQPGSPGEIGGFVEHASAELRDAASGGTYTASAVATSHGGMDITLSPQNFASHAEVIEGVYVDGEKATIAPTLEDALPQPLTKEAKAAATDEPKSDGTVSSVAVKAGANHLTNEVVIENKGLAAGVFATLGKHVEVNAIVQTNVWSDIDAIGATLSNWSNDDAGTQAFNIAEFERLDTSGLAGAGPGYSGFPQAWGLTKFAGDLTFTNWIEQVNFVSDNDVHVLSSSGVRTVVTTGENETVNSIDVTEIGLYYDLVLAGGDICDANLITQTNVLLDDDLIGAVANFETSGAAKISTQDNLLWNKARIVNAGGGADRFDNLPKHFRDAFDELASGGKELSDDVFKDSAFAGLAGLRILYVTGAVYSLQLIKQMNVLGDADQVALAMDKHMAKLDADWTITTGSNALVNVAAILDLDAMTKTYVGDGHFSDDFLIQAEIIKVDPMPGGQDADALISEAVAFLADDMLGCNDGGGESLAPVIGMHGAHSDIMQSVIS